MLQPVVTITRSEKAQSSERCPSASQLEERPSRALVSLPRRQCSSPDLARIALAARRVVCTDAARRPGPEDSAAAARAAPGEISAGRSRPGSRDLQTSEGGEKCKAPASWEQGGSNLTSPDAFTTRVSLSFSSRAV